MTARITLLLLVAGCSSADRDPDPEPWRIVYVHPDRECPNAGGAYENDGRAIEQEAGPGCEGR